MQQDSEKGIFHDQEQTMLQQGIGLMAAYLTDLMRGSVLAAEGSFCPSRRPLFLPRDCSACGCTGMLD